MQRVVILAGGPGKRLWPLSTNDRPKPFCRIFSNQTLLEETYHHFAPFGPVSVILSEKVADKAKQLLPPETHFILEKEALDTAYAFYRAALAFAPDDILLFVPSDHHYQSIIPILDTIEKALPFAKAGNVVVFGIRPTHNETCYGYFELGDSHRLLQFWEKPTQEVASQLIQNPNIYWNSGICLTSAATLLSEWEKHCPEKGTSFDKAVLQKTDKGIAFPLPPLVWDDFGNWESILAHFPDTDLAHNKIVGPVQTANVTNSFLYSKEVPIKVIGLTDVIVVATDDGILITSRQSLDKIRTLS